MNAIGLDHRSVAPGESRVFGEQIGPGRSARALAIVHIALFEVVNAVFGGYESYTSSAPPGTSVDAAMAQAAHDTLVAMFPSQADTFDGYLVDELQQLPAAGKGLGRQLGGRAARRILSRRVNDGSHHAEPLVGVDFFPSDSPGKWRPDPISQRQVALGAFWGQVEPFVLTYGGQFLAPKPPGLRSLQYAKAFDEVQRLGGDGFVTPTERTPDQTIAGIYWGYDGTPDLGAPPRLYNQIAMTIADQMGTGFVELARLLVLVNVAMADAGIEIWKSKYHYQYWRPVAGIREAELGTGPTGLGDRNPATTGDATYTPLGAPMSNTLIENLTPPFPAYPGHAGFGGALFETLRLFYGTDAIPFVFVSDEFNGVTTDETGGPRPLVPRRFSSLSEAEEENGQSRIYLGIHWSFDKTAGIAQGRHVAQEVFGKAFRPVCQDSKHGEEDGFVTKVFRN